MIELSERTEALARHLATAQDLTVDETIRQALEARAPFVRPVKSTGKPSPEVIAARREAIDRIVRKIASLPNLDPRSSEEIMDDLDPL